MMARVTDEQVRALHAQGLTDQQAAAELRLDAWSFTRRRKALGLPSNHRAVVLDIEKLRALVLAGNSDAVIAKIVGVSKTTICRHRHMLQIHSGHKRGAKRKPTGVARNPDSEPGMDARARVARAEIDAADAQLRTLLAGKRFEDHPCLAPSSGPAPKPLPQPNHYSGCGNAALMCLS